MACLWIQVMKETISFEKVLYHSPVQLPTVWSWWWRSVLHVMRLHLGKVMHLLDHYEHPWHGVHVYPRWIVKQNPNDKFALKYTCPSSIRERKWGVMIGVDQRSLTFNEVSKVDWQVNGEEFLIKRAVSSSCGLELVGEVDDWTPLISNIHVLLHYCSCSCILGIAHDGYWSIWLWISEQCGASKSFLSSYTLYSRSCFTIPLQLNTASLGSTYTL